MSEYIMNRESLKQHCEAMCHKFKDIPTSGTYGEHRLVLELLEQTEWIPVSEKLPEFRKEVLTCSNGGFIEIQSLEDNYDGYWENQKGDWTDLEEIIAWMPLPKPYEPQEKRCEDCNHYGKFSLDCGRCDDDCSMYEPKERSE